MNTIPQTESQLEGIEAEIQRTTGLLRQASQLTTALHRPRLDNTPGLLMQREYFGARYGRSRANHTLNRCPNGSTQTAEYMLKYRKLFMVHGHVFNPAYCVIFDVSGRYVISGSDDFLIKV